MNSKVSILLFVLSLFISEIGFSQANLLNARVPQDVGQLNKKQKRFLNSLFQGYVFFSIIAFTAFVLFFLFLIIIFIVNVLTY